MVISASDTLEDISFSLRNNYKEAITKRFVDYYMEHYKDEKSMKLLTDLLKEKKADHLIGGGAKKEPPRRLFPKREDNVEKPKQKGKNSTMRNKHA